MFPDSCAFRHSFGNFVTHANAFRSGFLRHQTHWFHSTPPTRRLIPELRHLFAGIIALRFCIRTSAFRIILSSHHRRIVDDTSAPEPRSASGPQAIHYTLGSGCIKSLTLVVFFLGWDVRNEANAPWHTRANTHKHAHTLTGIFAGNHDRVRTHDVRRMRSVDDICTRARVPYDSNNLWGKRRL